MSADSVGKIDPNPGDLSELIRSVFGLNSDQGEIILLYSQDQLWFQMLGTWARDLNALASLSLSFKANGRTEPWWRVVETHLMRPNGFAVLNVVDLPMPVHALMQSHSASFYLQDEDRRFHPCQVKSPLTKAMEVLWDTL